MSIEGIPNEIIALIADKLEVQDVVNFGTTCKKINKVIQEDIQPVDLTIRDSMYLTNFPLRLNHLRVEVCSPDDAAIVDSASERVDTIDILLDYVNFKNIKFELAKSKIQTITFGNYTRLMDIDIIDYIKVNFPAVTELYFKSTQEKGQSVDSYFSLNSSPNLNFSIVTLGRY